MADLNNQSRIVESFFEHRLSFAESWVDKWVLPNPFVSALLNELRGSGVELTDIFFNKEANSLGEATLTVSVKKFNAAVRLGLDSVTFVAVNPDWGIAAELIQIFDRILKIVLDILLKGPTSQKTILAFHVTKGGIDFTETTAKLVAPQVGLDASFCGVSIHRAVTSVMIDKSLKYPDAAFIRIERTHGPDILFSEVASQLYRDEVEALRLLGLAGID